LQTYDVAFLYQSFCSLGIVYSVVYVTMLSMAETIYRRLMASLVNNTLERVCNEVAVALFEVLDG
jgi:UDP-N-acetyl-D-mannosaminuronate dehydrogenase